MGFGEDFAAFAEIVEMVSYGVADFVFDFSASPACGDAGGKIGGVGGVTGSGLFDDDQILFHDAGNAS